MPNFNKRELSTEELGELRDSVNNFVTEFAKLNMSETVKGLISRAYHEANPEASTDVDDINGDLFSLVKDFSTSVVDDAIMAKTLTFGAKLNPTNFTESLSSLLYTYGKREAQERAEIFKMKFSRGDIPSKKEDPKKFSSEVKRMFTNLALITNGLSREFAEEYSLLSSEEDDIVMAIKEQIVEDVEKTEDKQKFISDLIEEVNEVKQEYVEAAEPKEAIEEGDNAELSNNDSGAQNSDSSDVDSSNIDESQNNTDTESWLKKYSLESDNSDEDKDSSDDDEESSEADVLGTYQNEDVLGGYGAHPVEIGTNGLEALKFYPIDFNTNYQTLTKELKSLEDAIKAITKKAIMETYGSEGWLDFVKNNVKGIDKKYIEAAASYVWNQDKFAKQTNLSDNIIRFKDYLEHKPVVNAVENFENSGRRFKFYYPTSKEVLDMGIKSHGKMHPQSKNVGEPLESYESLVREQLDNFLKSSKIRNFACSFESGCINIIQLWKLKQGNKMYEDKSYEDLYQLLTTEDFMDDGAKAELDEVASVAPAGAINPVSATDDGIDDAKTVIESQPDDDNADVKVINPNRGSETDNQDDNDSADAEAWIIPLSEFEKNHLNAMKADFKRLNQTIDKNLKIALESTFTPQMIDEWNEAVADGAVRKGKKIPPKITREGLMKEFMKYCGRTDEAAFVQYVKRFREASARTTWKTNKQVQKTKRFPVFSMPSMKALQERLSNNGVKDIGGIANQNILKVLGVIFFSMIPVVGPGVIITYAIIKNLGSFKKKFNEYMKKDFHSKYFKFRKDFWNSMLFELPSKSILASVNMYQDNEYLYDIVLDFYLNSRESFEIFFSNESIVQTMLPNSLLKFERTPVLSAEQLAHLYARKGDEGMRVLEKDLNAGIDRVFIIANANHNKKAMEKLDVIRKNMEDAMNIWRQYSMTVNKLGIRFDHIVDNYKNKLATQAVVKNLVNRGYLMPDKQMKLPNILKTGEYEGSVEELVDKTFQLELLKKKWNTVYPTATAAREALEVKDEELESSLIEATPEDKEFIKSLKDTIAYKNMDKFFTFDSLLNDFQSIFYKFKDDVNIHELVEGKGLQSKVLQGLESRRGALSETEKIMVERYINGISIESYNVTRYEQFAARILVDERNKILARKESAENCVISDGGVFNPEVAKTIREKAKMSVVCELTRRALGLETAQELSKTNLYLSEVNLNK